jgi:hypothetical protein
MLASARIPNAEPTEAQRRKSSLILLLHLDDDDDLRRDDEPPPRRPPRPRRLRGRVPRRGDGGSARVGAPVHSSPLVSTRDPIGREL